jgi:hypothetical protein
LAYGEEVSFVAEVGVKPPVSPGKLTCFRPDCPSEVVAVTSNEPPLPAAL